MEPQPPAAEFAFGDRLPLAIAFARELATTAVEWGLIGPGEPGRLWTRHLLNCVAVAPLVPDRATVLDVGSGAGLPGLVLAIARPDLHVRCVDAGQRRCDFLARVTDLLQLDVQVSRARVESLREQASVVTARAVAPLPRLLSWGLPVVMPGGMLIAIKGDSAAGELAGVSPRILGGARASVEGCEIQGRRYATVVRVCKPVA